MLGLLTCSTSVVEDYDSEFEYAAPVNRRHSTRSFIMKASPRIRRRKTTKMVIGSPTDFRHDVHLGRDLKPDHSYLLWDVERWREELAKRNLMLPPVTIPEPSTVTSERTPQKPSKRNSITPQKRKPVPSLIPPEASQPSPHDVPLPPSPCSLTCTDPESLPALEPPSRGPSIDESLPETVPVEKESDEIHMQKITMDPVVELHTDGT